MYKNAIKHAYNLQHYLSQRRYNIKILKPDMYSIIDNREKLFHDLDIALREEEKALHDSEAEFEMAVYGRRVFK